MKASYDERKSDPAVAAVTCPPVVVLRMAPEAIPEIHKFVELAVVAVIMVVLANGIESAVPAGAEKVMDGETVPTTVKDEHATPDAQDADEVPTD